MATARSTIQQIVAEEMGDYFTADTTGAGSTTTAVCTALACLPNGADDDAFIGWYIKITEACHCAVGEVRRITDYTGSTGTITVGRAFSATTGSGTAFELYRYDPTDYIVAIQRSLSGSWPHLYRHAIDESIVVDNILLNPGFDTFSGGFTNWTEVGSPTVTQETSITIHNGSSAKVISAAGCTDAQLTQTITFTKEDYPSRNISFWCWVYATAGCVARIRLDWDGCCFENSAYHSGTDGWQLLKLTGIAVPDSATQLKAICEVESGTNTAYFDAAAVWSDYPVNRYTMATEFIEYPNFVSMQSNEDQPKGRYEPLNVPPLSGRRIRIEGVAALSIPTTDAGTTEVDEPKLEAVVAGAMYHLSRILWNRSSTHDRTRFREDMQEYKRSWDELLARHAMAPMGAELGGKGLLVPQYHFERDDNSIVLVFDRMRGSESGIGFSYDL